MEYRSDILGVGAGTARAASITLNKVVVVADIMDGAEHGDRCVIHPDKYKNLLVDDHTSQGVPLELLALFTFRASGKREELMRAVPHAPMLRSRKCLKR